MAGPFIDELRLAGAEDELSRHQVSVDESLEVSWSAPRFFRDKVQGRQLMIGKTDGGRLLTIVVQPTDTHGAWDVVTGWDSSQGERTAWQNAK